MARKALFIDRDGTINRDCPYCHDLKDLYVYDDAVQIMKEYEENGYLIIIVTNQSGINKCLCPIRQDPFFYDSRININRCMRFSSITPPFRYL